jgi:hypothetical protein
MVARSFEHTPMNAEERPKIGRLLDSSSENHTGQNEPSGSKPPSRGRTEVKKERESKEDGRYIIFYSFEDEGEEDKGEDSGEGSTS